MTQNYETAWQEFQRDAFGAEVGFTPQGWRLLRQGFMAGFEAGQTHRKVEVTD